MQTLEPLNRKVSLLLAVVLLLTGCSTAEEVSVKAGDDLHNIRGGHSVVTIDDKVYRCNGWEISVLDAKTAKTIETIPVEECSDNGAIGISNLYRLEDDLIFLSGSGGTTIHRYNMTTGEESQLIVPYGANYFFVDDGIIYYTGGTIKTGNDLYFFDPATEETGLLMEEFPKQYVHVCVADGQVYYVLGDELYCVDLKTGNVSSTGISNASYPLAADDTLYYCADGDLLCTSNGNTDIVLGDVSRALLICGNKLYFDRAQGGISGLDLSTGNVESITDSSGEGVQISGDILFYIDHTSWETEMVIGLSSAGSK